MNGVLSNTGTEPEKYHFCLFRAMVINLKGHNDCNFHTSRFLTDFVSKSGHDPENFCGVSVEIVNEIVQGNLFIYDFDIRA